MTNRIPGKHRDKKLPDMRIAPPPDIPAYGGPTDQRQVVFPAGIQPGGEWEVQVCQRTRRAVDGNRLVDFAVCLQVRKVGSDEGWIDLERIDTAHGYVHLDVYGRDGKPHKDTAKVPARCKRDLDKALQWALLYIWDLDQRLAGWQ